jgi:hypothetical protein
MGPDSDKKKNIQYLSSASKGEKRVAFYGDPHGNFQGLRLATKIMDSRGVAERICLGDITHTLASAFTRDNLRRSESLRQQLNPDNSYWQAMAEGIYSESMLENAAGNRQEGLEIALKHAKKTYEIVKDIDSSITHIGGNHTVTDAIESVFGDKYKGVQLVEEDGRRVVYASGGGSAPVGEMPIADIFLADDYERGIDHSHELRKILLNPRGTSQEENEIDMIVTHIPPPLEGKHLDMYAKQFRDALLKRKAMGLPTPGLIVHGHHHQSSASVDWVTYRNDINGEDVEVLTFTPGVLDVATNMGSKGSFCIGKFDKSSNALNSIEEYHFHNTLDGLSKVVLYGEHFLDHDKKEVDFKHIGKVTLEEEYHEDFVNLAKLDLNHNLVANGLRTDYTGMSGSDLDLTLRQNLAIINHKADGCADKVKMAINEVYNHWLLEARQAGKLMEDTFTFADLQSKQVEIADILARDGASTLGINLSELGSTEYEGMVIRRSLLSMFFGIGFEDIQHATQVPQTTYDSIPETLGSELWGKNPDKPGKVKKHHVSIGQNEVIKGISREQWQNIVDEVYMPLSIKRTGELTISESVGLFSTALSIGLLSEQSLLNTGKHAKNQDFNSNPQDANQIKQRFNLKYVTDETNQVSDPLTLEPLSRTDFDPMDLERISSGTVPIYKDASGDFVITSGHAKKYLDKELTETLGYTPISIAEALDSGDATLIAGGDTYLFRNQVGAVMPIDVEKEGLDPENYNAKPLWLDHMETQDQQQILQQNQAEQQQYISDLIRQQQANSSLSQNNDTLRNLDPNYVNQTQADSSALPIL